MTKFKQIAVAAAIGAACTNLAVAASASAEIQELGKTLTPWGAEVAGNKEGTIPAYTGGLTTPPSTYKPGSGRYPDPYQDEKPLFTIDSKNMDKYAEKLAEGVKVLMKKWPGYRVDVYPTHRSAAFPKFYADNSILNASRSKLVASGNGVDGAYGGMPFPIPKSGLEAVWNHFLRYQPMAWSSWQPTYLADATGKVTLIHTDVGYYENPYFDPAKSKLDGYTVQKFIASVAEPAMVSGEINLGWYSNNYDQQEQRVWTYQPGQRRVRLAPEFKYDTPSSSYSGAILWDEAFMYSGAPDRYDFKLIGKQEMYVPYNTNRVSFSPHP